MCIIGLVSSQLQPEQTEPSESTEPATEPTEPPEPTQSREEQLKEQLLSLIETIIKCPLSDELVETIGSNEGRYQSTFLNVTPENVQLFKESIQRDFHFTAYYEEIPVEKGIKYVFADQFRNIVTLEYHSNTSNKGIIRFERYDGIQTIELKPEYFTQSD